MLREVRPPRFVKIHGLCLLEAALSRPLRIAAVENDEKIDRVLKWSPHGTEASAPYAARARHVLEEHRAVRARHVRALAANDSCFQVTTWFCLL